MSLLLVVKALVLTLSLAHSLAAFRALRHYKASTLSFVLVVPMTFFFWPLMSLQALLSLEDNE